jgi:hypothetical protein
MKQKEIRADAAQILDDLKLSGVDSDPKDSEYSDLKAPSILTYG